MSTPSLKWRRSEKVDGYESTDGVWVIEHAVAYTFCENPHPQGKGNPYCYGGEEHAYKFWTLWRDDGSEPVKEDSDDTLASLKAFAEELAAADR
jgi:hypothetical protein